ncbi:unnamed protein product [Somion occarium]|uniref:UFSP1/2/DUB catalytic domain-containing protein n=1 Tax=Somion occarium TaxID=3059160 RepID=A0ABP1D8T8_9APHY
MGKALDEDVQFLYSVAPEPFLCELCAANLDKETPQARQAHYDSHLDNESQASASTSKPKSPTKALPNAKRIFTRERTSEEFWYPSKSTPSPRNHTPSLIPLIRKALLRLHAKGQVQKAYLCFPGAVHVSQELWDAGWGCGYRNFMMACSSMVERDPIYFPLLDDPIPPGVRNLQSWIEQAWHEGFDLEGAEQLRNKLAGTSKWIGTAELYVAFTYRGIPSQLVDFDLTRHGGIEPLLNWVVEYFAAESDKQSTVNDALRGATPVVVTDKMPFILQHQGHSRTIIGFERRKDGTISLLMFDPTFLPKHVRDAALSIHSGDSSSPVSLSSERHNLSPSKLFNKVMHPYKSERKRKASDTSPTAHSTKRVRNGDIDNDVIVIDSDDENAPGPSRKPSFTPELDPIAVIKPFRLPPDKLKRNDKYQILYFPMTDSWDRSARLARRIVTSVKMV